MQCVQCTLALVMETEISREILDIGMTAKLDPYTHTRVFPSEFALFLLWPKQENAGEKKKKKLKRDGGGDGVYFCYLFDLECEFAFIFNAVVLSSNATNNNLDESKGGKHYYYVFVFLAQRRICVGGGRQRENSVYAHPQMESPPKLKYLKSSLWLEAVCV